MRRALIVGNWKMNLDHVEAVHLTQQLAVILASRPAEHVDVVVAPPFVDLRSVTSVIEAEHSALEVAAQHVNPLPSGAHTGEIAVPMLARLHVRWVIVGHSERRTLYGMDDQIVAETARAAIAGGLRAIVCVGEAEDIRARGEHRAFVESQVAAALGALRAAEGDVVVAYEPIWAIGTGRTASVADVAEMTGVIRAAVTATGLTGVRVLYGGSVTGDNAAELLGADVDGFLVGGASLRAESFAAIIAAGESCYAGGR
ncbi:MAG: triose-phosphate isomerase [Acidimicrobiales bacterium]